MYRKLLLVVFIAGFCFQTQAQYNNHLILKKGYKIKHHFLTGDSIRFLANNFEFPVIGRLEAIGEDFIVIRGQVFAISEINTLFYYRKSFNFRAGGKVLQIAGPGFLVISAFNAIYNSIRPIWTISNLITSGSLILSGLILPLLQVRKYVLGNRFFLRIVPSDPETMRVK